MSKLDTIIDVYGQKYKGINLAELTPTQIDGVYKSIVTAAKIILVKQKPLKRESRGQITMEDLAKNTSV